MFATAGKIGGRDMTSNGISKNNTIISSGTEDYPSLKPNDFSYIRFAAGAPSVNWSSDYLLNDNNYDKFTYFVIFDGWPGGYTS